MLWILAQAGDDAGKKVADATAELSKTPNLLLDSLATLWKQFVQSLPMVVIAVIMIILTAIAAAIVTRILREVLSKTHLRSSLAQLARQLAYITIWTIGILATAITTTGLDFGQVIATLGLGSIAIGFAFKDIFENFFAGILILWRFPFDPGDYIQCNDIEGKVEDITIRMTLIRQTDGQLVTIPNATLFKEPVWVMTSRPTRRTTIICGVAYGEDVDESRSVIEAAVKKCDTVHADQPVQIFAQEFADSSINFEVTWWTGNTPLDIRKSRDQVVAAVKRGLDEAGIEIPFPYRTLTFKEPLPLTRPPADEPE